MLIDINDFNLDVASVAQWNGLTVLIQFVTGTTAVLYFNCEIENPISFFL